VKNIYNNASSDKKSDLTIMGWGVGGVCVCGCGFWYLRSRWTPSVGVSVSSVLHAVCVEGLAH